MKTRIQQRCSMFRSKFKEDVNFEHDLGTVFPDVKSMFWCVHVLFLPKNASFEGFVSQRVQLFVRVGPKNNHFPNACFI